YELDILAGERLTLRCSPADRVFLLGAGAKYRAIGEQGITEATFDLSDWESPYARIVVRDVGRRKAWTNPVWFDV
ncbi:MAG TPA: hypothetical protein VFO36_13800, partial [Nitrospiraceae bacterium]|nr:hypothetical protein [Nitrospiraceae bacterium]